MLLAQTRWDRKETRMRHSVRALNMKYTLEFVFIERYAMLFCQLTKWPHKHTLCDACCLFCKFCEFDHLAKQSISIGIPTAWGKN